MTEEPQKYRIELHEYLGPGKWGPTLAEVTWQQGKVYEYKTDIPNLAKELEKLGREGCPYLSGYSRLGSNADRRKSKDLVISFFTIRKIATKDDSNFAGILSMNVEYYDEKEKRVVRPRGKTTYLDDGTVVEAANGISPTKFIKDGKVYTPHEYQKKFFPKKP